MFSLTVRLTRGKGLHGAMAGAAAWFPWVLGIRVLNALVVRTYFTPDEYWQGPEVAHHAVFGFGHLTWEWQSEAQIRGFAHPALYAVCFWVLQVLVRRVR